MAASLPVIASTNAGEIRQRVEQGHTGYLVPPFRVPELRDVMRHLARDAPLRSELGRSGHAKVAQFTVDRWAAEFEQLVKAVARS